MDEANGKALPYATVALYRQADSSLVSGTLSSDKGDYRFESVLADDYRLEISYVGYMTVAKDLHVEGTKEFFADTIRLKMESVELEEALVVGERVKVKTEGNSTTYFINTKASAASSTGSDLLQYIPGVGMGLMKEISLNGSTAIRLLVNGKERDQDYVNQLDAQQIERIEIIDAPGAKYEGSIDGVIHIILKKDEMRGVNGHIYAEIPTSKATIYSFPTASLEYGFERMNLYMSYGGEFASLDKTHTDQKILIQGTDTTRVESLEHLRQDNRNQRLTYGIDFFINKRNQINFYAFYNPYSSEDNGWMDMQLEMADSISTSIYTREKEDRNMATFYSLYFRHSFDKPMHEFSVDLSHYHYRAGITTSLAPGMTNISEPLINYVSLKADYTLPLGSYMNLETGLKNSIAFQDYTQTDGFTGREIRNAIYASMQYGRKKLKALAGLRLSNFSNGAIDHQLSLLPTLFIHYSITQTQHLKASFKYYERAPRLQDLNPQLLYFDLFAFRKGNADLAPEYMMDLFADYSISRNNNFISMRLFYQHLDDGIFEYSFVNNDGILETNVNNLGAFHRYGLQCTGTLKLGKQIDINAYARYYIFQSDLNTISELRQIGNTRQWGLESNVSLLADLRRGMSLSAALQIIGPEYGIQRKNFKDPLYSMTFTKSFREKLKVGVTALVPFRKSYTYQGSEARGMDYYYYAEGNVSLPGVVLVLKAKYQFSSGKGVNKIERVKDEIADELY
jgi:outer membrane receptor for ferrienterochelin and colicin